MCGEATDFTVERLECDLLMIGAIMPLRKNATNQLAALFAQAEAERMCLHTDGSLVGKALNRRTKTGEVVRVFSGLYVRASYWQTLSKREQMRHIIRTLATMHPNWVFSHSSAAIMYSLEVSFALYYPIHFCLNPLGGSNYAKEFKCHRLTHPIALDVAGTAVTSIEQTVVDCAAEYPFGEALAIADSALHQGLTDKARLLNYLENRTNRRGVRKAQRVIAHADARAESGGESIVRAVMIEAGLPTPELQAPIANIERPGHNYYVDFMFTRSDGGKVAVELDGREKYHDMAMTGGRDATGVMMAERQREAAITAEGVRVVRFSFRDACNPQVLLPRLAKYGIAPEVRRVRGKKFGEQTPAPRCGQSGISANQPARQGRKHFVQRRAGAQVR